MKINGNLFDSFNYIEITEGSVTISRKWHEVPEVYLRQNIKSLEIVVHTYEYIHKGSAYTRIDSIIVQIHINGGQVSVDIGKSMKRLCKLMACKHFYRNFKLNICGPRDGIDIPLRIYSKTGILLPLRDSDTILNMDLASASFTGMSIFFLYEQYNMNSSSWININFVPVIPVFIIGLVLSSIIIYQEYLKYKIRKIIGI